MAIRCFWIEDTERARVELRRYRSSYNDEGGKCSESGMGYHDASYAIGECRGEKVLWQDSGRMVWKHDKPEITRDDPRFPKACACGYDFSEADYWQVNAEPLYRRLDTGEEMTLREAPIGAMWHCWWYEDHALAYGVPDDGKSMFRVGPDGRCISVKTPGGEWPIDQRSSQGSFWTRSGEAPNITASPSILQPHYHGWLRDGELVPV